MHTPTSPGRGILDAAAWKVASFLGQTALAGLWRGKYLEALAANLQHVRLPGRSELLDLEQVYLPPRLQEEPKGGHPGQPPRTLWEALLRSSTHLLFLGPAGTGKTVLLRWLALQFARGKAPPDVVERFDLKYPVPILVDLREFATSGHTLFQFLVDLLRQHQFPYPGGFLQDQLRAGRCVLLFDGLDRVTAEVADGIVRFTEQHPDNLTLVTARPAGRKELANFTPFSLLRFDDHEQEAFLHQWFGDQPEQADRLLAALERNPRMRDLASTPFFLAMLASAFERKGLWPVSCAALLGEVAEILLAEGADPESRPRYDPQVKRQALQGLASHLHSRQEQAVARDELDFMTARLFPAAEQESAALVDELESTGLLRQKDDRTYEFAHPAWQEFLVAQALAARGEAETLLEHASPWWREVLVLAAGLREPDAGFIRRVREGGQPPEAGLLLAARCLAEGSVAEEGLQEEMLTALLQLFSRDEPELWPAATMTIAGLMRCRIRTAFTALLHDENVERRAQAALALGRIGREQEWTRPLLYVALRDDPAGPVRANAARALGQIQDERSIRALVAALIQDEDEAVWRATAQALGAMGQAAVEPLLRILPEEKRKAVRQKVATALGSTGPSAVPALITTLHGRSWEEREGAAIALGLIKEERAVGPLLAALRDERIDVVGAAAQALAAFGPVAAGPLVTALMAEQKEQVRERIVEILGQIGAPAVPRLFEAMQKGAPAEQEWATRALVQIGDPALEHLIEKLGEKSWEVRRLAIKAMDAFPGPRVTEALIARLRDEREDIRQEVVEALGRRGDERAVAPLIPLLLEDQSERVRWRAATALGRLEDGRAVEPLLLALNDEHAFVQENAASALSQIGGPTVEPLIAAFYQGRVKEETTARILRAIGAQSKKGEASLPGLADAFARLLSSKSLDEALAVLPDLRWWRHGEELARSFQAAQAFLGYKNLEAIEQAQDELAWLPEISQWLCPPLKGVLSKLGSLAEDMRLYARNPDRAIRRDALLHALDTLADVQNAVQTDLREPARGAFQQVVGHWRRLIEVAIRELRGRADLRPEFAEEVPLGAPDTPVIVAFALTNEGDSPARNLQVTLKPARPGEFDLIGEATQPLPPLGSRGRQQVEFALMPHRPESIELVCELRYDDDEREGHFLRVPGRIRFWKMERREIPRNPYIPGTPVEEPRMFYGREDICEWVRHNITGAYQGNVLILYGLRRMGKTSVLKQLRLNPVLEDHLFIFIDLQAIALDLQDLGGLFYGLARKIWDDVGQRGVALPEPSRREYQTRPHERFEAFLLETRRAVGQQWLVLMVDEFDKLIQKVREGVIEQEVFDFLRSLIQHTRGLAFLFAGGFALIELRQEQGVLFNTALWRRISFLDRAAAEELIREPLRGYLHYHPFAAEKVRRVTAHHPYYIQFICHSLVERAREQKKNYVDLPDIEHALRETIRGATSTLEDLVRRELSGPERRVLAALAAVTDEGRPFVSPAEVAQVLGRYDLAMPAPELTQALEQLTHRELVVESRAGRQLLYGFSMELLWHWLREREELRKLREEERQR